MFWSSKNSYKKETKTYNFDAFISYKQKYDQEVANILEHDIEHYRIPRKFRKKIGKKKLKVFLDKDELCVTNDLNAQIKKNLKNSNFLIVVCSPEAKTAPWIKKEINFFKSTHGNSDKNIIPVLIKDKIENAVPNMLIERDEDDQVKRLVVPYKEKQERNKELPRIIATLIGCGYNDLVQRVEKEDKIRRGILTVIIAAISMIFTATCVTIKIKNDNALRKESENLSIRSESEYDQYDREKAIETALKALPSKRNKRPEIPEAKRALLTATEAYKFEEMEMGVVRNIKIDVPVKEYAVYEKGKGTYISILGEDASIHVYNIKTGETFDLDTEWTTNGKTRKPDDVHIIMCEENQLLYWNSNYIASINLDKEEISWKKVLKIDNSREYANLSYNSDVITVGLESGKIIILDKKNGKQIDSVVPSKVITKMNDGEKILAKISTDGCYLICHNMSCAYLYDRNEMKFHIISDDLQSEYGETDGYIMGDFCIFTYTKGKKKDIYILCYDMKREKIIFEKRKKNVKNVEKGFYIPWFIPFENAMINGKNMDINISIIGNSMILIDCQSGKIIYEIQFPNYIQGAFLQKRSFIYPSKHDYSILPLNYGEDVLTVIFENGECVDYSFQDKNISESYKVFENGVVHPKKIEKYFLVSYKNRLNEVKEDNTTFFTNYNIETHQSEYFSDGILVYGNRKVNTDWKKITDDYDCNSCVYPYKNGFLIFQSESCIYYDIKKKSVVWENRDINHAANSIEIIVYMGEGFFRLGKENAYEYLGTEDSEQCILIGSLEKDFHYKIQFLNESDGKVFKTDDLDLESFNNTSYKFEEVKDFKRINEKLFFSIKLEKGYGMIISYDLVSEEWHDEKIELKDSSDFIKILAVSHSGQHIFWGEFENDSLYLNSCSQSAILDMNNGKLYQLELDENKEKNILLTPNPCWSDNDKYMAVRSDKWIFIFSKKGDCMYEFQIKDYIFAGFGFFENMLYVIGEENGNPMLYRYDVKSGNSLESLELKGRSGFDGGIFDINCIKTFDSEVILILNINSFQGYSIRTNIDDDILQHNAWIINQSTGKSIAFIQQGAAYNQDMDYIFANKGVVNRYTTEELVRKALRMK